MAYSNPVRDREPGLMSVGMNKSAEPDWESSEKAPKETAEGWESKSFSLDLKGGADLSSYHANSPSPSDGPAWPSESKNRK